MKFIKMKKKPKQEVLKDKKEISPKTARIAFLAVLICLVISAPIGFLMGRSANVKASSNKEELDRLESKIKSTDKNDLNIFLAERFMEDFIKEYMNKPDNEDDFNKRQNNFRCLTNAFQYTGGVPTEIWFDNMKTVVDRSRSQFSKVVFNERFRQYAKEAGFLPIACRAFRPQTKGKVEALARTIERIRVFNYEFESTHELEKIIQTIMDSLNTEEISQAIHECPSDRWSYEKEQLSSFDANQLKIYASVEKQIKRKVSNEAMVQWNQNKYSVPVNYIGKILTLRVKEDKLYIYDNSTLIRTHTITHQLLNYHRNDYIEIQEINSQNEKQKENRLRKANLPFKKTINDFDFGFQPKINRTEILDLCTLRFMDANNNILFIGNSGVGKTHLAISITLEAIAKGYSCHFVLSNELVNRLNRANQRGNLDRLLKKYASYDLLIIDKLVICLLPLTGQNCSFN